MNVSKIKPTLDPTGKPPSSIDVPESMKNSSGSTKPLAPMPPDCITKMYLEEGFRENTPAHLALEWHFGFGYKNLLGELMYAFVS